MRIIVRCFKNPGMTFVIFLTVWIIVSMFQFQPKPQDVLNNFGIMVMGILRISSFISALIFGALFIIRWLMAAKRAY